MAKGSRIQGITIELDGDATKFEKTIKSLDTSIKGTQGALKDVNNLLKLDPKNTDLLRQKQELLKKAIEDTKTKLDTLKQAQAQMDANGVDKNSDQYQRLQREIIATEQELKKLETQANNSKSALYKIGEVGEKFQKVGTGMQNAGKALAPISAAAGAIAGAGVKSAASFDQAMSQVAATMGRTNDDIKNTQYTVGDFSGTLDDFAKKLGAETAFSAKEAAEGINTLAMAGLSSEDIIASLPSVLDLAAAGSMDMASAASYAMGAVKGFGDDAENAQKYIDFMAKGATLANTNVAGLGEALGSAAATANAYGQSAETVTVSLLKLANQNVTGSTAATMLSRAMADLYTPTAESAKAMDALGVSAYDSNGQARDLTEVMADLQTATAKMSTEERNAALSTIFTTNGLKAYNMMAATSAEETEALYAALGDSSGSASEQAATLLDNLNGHITLLKSALEGAAISIGNALMPVIEGVVGVVQRAVDWFNGLTESQKQLIATVLLVVAALAPVLLIGGKIVTVIGTVITKIGALIPIISGISAPVLIVIGVITALVAAFTYLYKTNEDFRNKVNVLWEQIKEKIAGIIETIKAIIQAALILIQEFWAAHGEEIMTIVNAAWDFIENVVRTVTNVIQDVLSIFLNILQGNWKGAWEAVKKLLSDVWEGMKGIVEAANQVVQNIIDTALNIIKDLWSTAWEAVRQKLSEIWDKIKETVTQMVETIKEKAGELKDTIVQKVGEAVQFIEDLPGRALAWGRDMIDNFIAGIKEAAERLWDEVESIAEGVADFLGFSEPKKGPLSNFHTYAPDMIDLFTTGIRDNMWKVTDAMNEMTGAMATSTRSADIRVVTPVYLDGQVITTVVNEQLGAML